MKWRRLEILSAHFITWKRFFSVVDPDPDPHVSRPPGAGSGSTCQRYGSGSGSFYHAKIVRKTLIPSIMPLFNLQKWWKNTDPLVIGMDSRNRIRIKPKMSWIRNTVFLVPIVRCRFGSAFSGSVILQYELRIRIRCFLTPGSGFRINITDKFSENKETVWWGSRYG
jgi:hypothetical protein